MLWDVAIKRETEFIRLESIAQIVLNTTHTQYASIIESKKRMLVSRV